MKPFQTTPDHVLRAGLTLLGEARSRDWWGNVNHPEFRGTQEGWKASATDRLQAAITRGEWEPVVWRFGNAADLGLSFLTIAWALIPEEQRPSLLLHMWSMGKDGTNSQAAHLFIPLVRDCPHLRAAVTALHLPRVVKVYRGVRAVDEVEGRRRMKHPSWSLDPGVAEIFPTLEGRATHGVGYKGEMNVHAASILAFIDDRQEREVILDPSRIRVARVRIRRL